MTPNHQYEVIIETATNFIVSSYAHTRQGLEDALRRIESHKVSQECFNAIVWSSKDDLIVFSMGPNSEGLMLSK